MGGHWPLKDETAPGHSGPFSLVIAVSEGRPAESATRTGGSGLGEGGRRLTSDGQAQTRSNPGIPRANRRFSARPPVRVSARHILAA
jgi:hypothetical protein